ncbi:hypothetical protein ABT095_37605 [Kitasatospora sp. NPDC002227]|uniref:hypothetical protein n=1 Tax=Kitasatospora sp. NPDC002227 TaxID=3154773 RepID=UPI0033274F37
MTALELACANAAATPGGAQWLYVQDIPVRRLVNQLVRKVMAISSAAAFGHDPGPLEPTSGEALISLRPSSFSEYRAYTITWSGVAYALGADLVHNPPYAPQLVSVQGSVDAVERLSGLVSRAEVLALSWSSRHWETLLPVLEQLGVRGHSSAVLDLATEPGQRVPNATQGRIGLCRVPAELLAEVGTIPGAAADRMVPPGTRTVDVAGHHIHLDRVEHLATMLLALTAGCTQPSWAAVEAVERWLNARLAAASPHTVLLSNDISPLGALAVHAAERHGAATVNVQHGAWTADAVSRPSLHSQHLVVMGQRDALLAQEWARHPKARVHVLGQPRFDALTGSHPVTQRSYLDGLLPTRGVEGSLRRLVWACQPFSPERLSAQADMIRSGLLAAKDRWALVIAPHPAQDPAVFEELKHRVAPAPVAVVDTSIGARGCLAGADAVVSVASTCGLEAVLLGVPVLELIRDGDPCLGLAEQGVAAACSDGDAIAAALDAGPAAVDQSARDSVCYWRGTTSADIAELVISASHQRSSTPRSEHARPEAAQLGVGEEEGAHHR